MTPGSSRQETALAELEVALSSAQQRAAEATRKFNAEARRADARRAGGPRSPPSALEEAEERAAEAMLRVAELEQEIDVVRAELDAWQSEPYRRHA